MFRERETQRKRKCKERDSEKRKCKERTAFTKTCSMEVIVQVFEE